MMSLKEISDEMSTINNWALEESSISKVFSFNNFKESLDFVNKAGEIAEKHNHHPDIMISYNQVRLSLTTHYEKGLTKKDFEVAKEIDDLLNN